MIGELAAGTCTSYREQRFPHSPPQRFALDVTEATQETMSHGIVPFHALLSNDIADTLSVANVGVETVRHAADLGISMTEATPLTMSLNAFQNTQPHEVSEYPD